MDILFPVLIVLLFIAWSYERNIFNETIEKQEEIIRYYEELILKLEGENER